MDALALGADEGRGRLRKAPVSCLTSVITEDVRMGKPGCGNSQSLWSEYIGPVEVSRGTETSKYPEEEKENSTP